MTYVQKVAKHRGGGGGRHPGRRGGGDRGPGANFWNVFGVSTGGKQNGHPKKKKKKRGGGKKWAESSGWACQYLKRNRKSESLGKEPNASPGGADVVKRKGVLGPYRRTREVGKEKIINQVRAKGCFLVDWAKGLGNLRDFYP